MKYANATKDTWRGWAWNQIESRIGRSKHYAPKTVCVLAGDCAGDLPHAKKRGFECVGVDINENCVKTFRESGGIAVNGSLHFQAVAIQPDAVIADMLGGLTPKNLSVLIDCSVASKAVVINLLRGRDKGMRRFPEICKTADYSTGRKKDIQVGNHRGCAIVMLLAQSCARDFGSEENLDNGFTYIPQWIVQKFKPCFYSYKSKDGNQWFDSVAITTAWLGANMEMRDIAKETVPKKQLQRAAAVKALITTRRNNARKRSNQPAALQAASKRS